MGKTLAAAALALAMGMISLASAEDFRWSGPLPQTRTKADSGPALKEADVPLLRAALNLRPDQHAHWAPVEAALTDLARQQSREAPGLVQRASGVATRAMHLRRLKAVAGPLIRSLDDAQKRDAVTFARRMGYGQLMASFQAL